MDGRQAKLMDTPELAAVAMGGAALYFEGRRSSAKVFGLLKVLRDQDGVAVLMVSRMNATESLANQAISYYGFQYPVGYNVHCRIRQHRSNSADHMSRGV